MSIVNSIGGLREDIVETISRLVARAIMIGKGCGQNPHQFRSLSRDRLLLALILHHQESPLATMASRLSDGMIDRIRNLFKRELNLVRPDSVQASIVGRARMFIEYVYGTRSAVHSGHRRRRILTRRTPSRLKKTSHA